MRTRDSVIPAKVGPLQRALAAATLTWAAFFLQGCQTAPADDASATPAASAASPASSAAGPRRLEANRPSAPAPTAKAATTTTKPAATTTKVATAAKTDPTTSLLDAGAEVDGNVGSERVSPRARTAAQRPGGDPAGTAPAPAHATPQNIDDQKPIWALLLASFTGAEHRADAEAARVQITQRFPSLKGAYVRTTHSGSAVFYGRFDGVKDPVAADELKRVKELGEGTSKPFGRAMLTRLSASPNDAPPGPNDLRIVRQAHPKGTLFTLQVAAWSSLGTKELSMSQIKRSSEAYAQQLRTQGYDAYYFHDFDTQTSTVTVGVFGPDSYDSRSTLYAPEVEAVMRKFSKSLLNGEELLVPVDPKRPGSKVVPQAPRLVEIPK